MRRFFALIERQPILSFTVLLILLFGVIVAASKLRAPEVQPTLPARTPRAVSLFTVGTDTPRLSLPAQVKKAGIVNVVSLVPGIVTRIHTQVGQNVGAFQPIMTLDNDNGSGSAGLRARIAAENQRLAERNFSAEKRVLSLEAKRDDDAAVSDTEEALAAKRAKIGKRALESARAVSRLATRLAESEIRTLSPGSPIAGRIERLGVRIGDFIPAGATVATVAVPRAAATLEARIPFTTALVLDPEGKFEVSINGEVFAITPRSLSGSEDKDGLFTLVLDLPPALAPKLADETFVSINVPLAPVQNAMVLIPLDALFQENGVSSVHSLDAASRISTTEVRAGPVYGSFVSVSGLESGATLVTDRSGRVGETITPAS